MGSVINVKDFNALKLQLHKPLHLRLRRHLRERPYNWVVYAGGVALLLALGGVVAHE